MYVAGCRNNNASTKCILLCAQTRYPYALPSNRSFLFSTLCEVSCDGTMAMLLPVIVPLGTLQKKKKHTIFVQTSHGILTLGIYSKRNLYRFLFSPKM